MPARKKSKANKSSLPGAPSKRGRLPGKIQHELAEYNRPGFIVNDWWELQDADSTWDPAAGFCWEVLRRHPVGRVLEKLEEAIEGDLQLELDYHSTRPKGPGPIRPLQYEIDHRYGQEVLNAIRCFAELSRQDFASLHKRDGETNSRPISPWLLNYRSLWEVLDEKERVPSSAIELRDPQMSERNPKGRACINLVRPAPSNRAPSDLPPFEGYDPEPVLGIGMWTYCDGPVDSGGLPDGAPIPDGYPDSDSKHPINRRLGIRYSHLESELRKVRMRPLVLAVREDSPKEDILREIGDLLDTLLPSRSRSKHRKIEQRNFDVLRQMDREVIDEKLEVVSSGTKRNFLRTAALKPDRFVSFCRNHLALRRAFFEKFGFSGFEGRAFGVVSF